ncbi:TRAP transporter small permease [Celeribacter sp.]|uniref:TRAP transporter small permease n=1 Tax=Celeribacter sp. TaxID=1890673 RepID=UPI003A8DF847
MIGKFLEQFCRGLRVVIALLTMALAIPVAAQVLARYTGVIPVYLWTEELATFIFVWVVMIGSMIAVWDGTHFAVLVLPDATSPLGTLIQNGFVLVLLIAFGIMFAWYGVAYAKFGALQHSVMMNANMFVTHVSVPIAGAVWAIFASYRLSQVIANFRNARGAAA